MVHVMHILFMFFVFFFAVFKNLKSSFAEDNMPVYALDVFIENVTKMDWFIPLNANKWGLNFKVASKLCTFLYNAIETTAARQGMGIMHSNVKDTVFHSGDACDSKP